MTSKPRYATFADVVEQEIKPALGSFADEYDVQKIARDTFRWTIETDGDGNYLLDTAGYMQDVPDDQFWAIVAYCHIDSTVPNGQE